MGLRAVLVKEVEELQQHRRAWDELAVLNAMPYGSPAWTLSWWRHVAAAQASLRTVLVMDGQELVGVAPFFIDQGIGGVVRCRLLGSSRRDLVVAPGLEQDVAAIVTHTLGVSEPSPDVFMLEGVPDSRDWPTTVTELWPRGRLNSYPQYTQPAPTVDLSGRTYDQWFRSKSHHFRKSMRRTLRQLKEAGGTVKLTEDPLTLTADLKAFVRLHHKRWSSRGGSSVLNEGVERMLVDVGEELIGQLRFRLWSIQLEGDTISSNLFLSAGGETAYWLGGFDERWAELEPSILSVLCAIQHAFSVGDRRVDLGSGGQSYKYRFSDGEDRLEWTLLVRSGLKAPLARIQMLPQRTRMVLAQRLPQPVKKAVRRRLSLLAKRARTGSRGG